MEKYGVAESLDPPWDPTAPQSAPDPEPSTPLPSLRDEAGERHELAEELRPPDEGVSLAEPEAAAEEEAAAEDDGGAEGGAGQEAAPEAAAPAAPTVPPMDLLEGVLDKHLSPGASCGGGGTIAAASPSEACSTKAPIIASTPLRSLMDEFKAEQERLHEDTPKDSHPALFFATEEVVEDEQEKHSPSPGDVLEGQMDQLKRMLNVQ